MSKGTDAVAVSLRAIALARIMGSSERVSAILFLWNKLFFLLEK